MFEKLILLAIAGAAGTLARYGLDSFVSKHWVWGKMPTGLLVVNTLGCFIYGFVTPLADSVKAISPETKFYLLTGFTAAFTTFSSFMFKENEFLMEDYMRVASLYLALSLSFGVFAVYIGQKIGSLL